MFGGGQAFEQREQEVPPVSVKRCPICKCETHDTNTISFTQKTGDGKWFDDRVQAGELIKYVMIKHFEG
jgi:hypothetical protein